MDIFVSGIPLSCTERDIKNTLKPYLLVVGIQHFELRVFTTKNGNRCGNLTVASAPDAEKFILKYGPQYGLPRRANPWSIFMGGRAINFQKSREAVDPFVLQRIRRAEKQSISGSKIFTKPSDDRSNTIMIESIECGFFDYPQSGQLVFHNCHKQYRSGSLVFGRKRLLIILNETKDNANRTRIQIEYASIYSISGHSRKNSNFVINVMNPPMFYQDTMANDSIEDDVSSAFGRLGLVTMEPQTSRSCHLGGSHAAAVGSCPTYWINFKGPGDFKNALKRLREERSAPKPLHQEIPIYRKDFNFSQEMMLLNNILADSVDVPFAVKFQLQMLAQNGILNPQKVRRLRDPVAEMLQELDTVQVAEGIRALKNVLDFAGPNCNGDSFTLEALVKLIKQRALNYPLRNSMYRTARRHDHLALVYKAYVSPASIWLGGPELETKNRVLRKYPNNLDYFIRVNFCDEDGEQVRYEYKVNRDAIFKQRFADFLNNGKLIAGRQFGFLGFSHSSLRSQTCWFVSPFVLSGSLLLAKHLIRDLGDFSRIYSPAKCAARIGQAFSDAADSVAFAEEELECIPDIEREGRCFTDGVGTISFSLLRRVWRRFSRNKKAYAPILQVRFQGCKGLLALDNTIDRNLIRYRDSMNKFPAPKHLELEITGASYKPLTMYLNRQFIKILEDLGADTASFLKLQTQVLADIEKTVESPLDTAKYLDNNLFGTGVGLSSLIRSLYQAGFHFKDDVFLRQVVEIATRVQLRELKHKARIPVPDAHLLYGVVDETGFLKPNEVHVILKEKRGRQTTRIGDVLITRAPAMHPGDFQFVTAVDVPRESQNEKLYNCVIFSQHGSRDIPSMLSGGDLDGDLFNVIFDSSLFPKHTCDPADYPRPQAIDIGREVTTKDMSKFFLEFMEQDKLGYICNTHMIIADQKPEGVFDQNCITLAEMASTAVDFSKTGIPVDMERFPHNSYNKNRRPDFMAQTPHLILNSSEASLEADDDEMIYHDVKDDVDAFAPGNRTVRYYESPHILGKLYRNVDETEFVRNMNQVYGTSTDRGMDFPGGLLGSLWKHVQRAAIFVEWNASTNMVLARNIRKSYEERLVDLMFQYSPDHRQPLSELEMFCGTMLGRNGSFPSKRVRETNVDMRQSFERHAREIIRWVRSGRQNEEDDEDIGGEEDDDENWDNLSAVNSAILTGEQEKNLSALQRSVACLSVAIHEPHTAYGRQVGQLRSFAYLAAGLCLKCLSRYEEMKKQMQHKERAALGGENSTRSGRAAYGVRGGRGLPN